MLEFIVCLVCLRFRLVDFGLAQQEPSVKPSGWLDVLLLVF